MRPMIKDDKNPMTASLDDTGFRLMFVDDEPQVLNTLKRTFMDEGYALFTARSGEEALLIMKKQAIDVAIIDLKMPGMDGMTLLKTIGHRFPETKVIMLTAHGSIRDALEAIRNGATDFLEKPFVPEGLTARIRQLYNIWTLSLENRQLKAEIGFRFNYDKLIGSSARMLKLKKTISRIGPSDATVLVLGETGTGKELTAKAIHFHSPRASNGFVAVDCAAINETMLESELFGHSKGAFTGAHTATTGLIRAAEGGTLFFDEIGELSLTLQAKLLRVLQEREVRPVGSTRTHKVDIRVIAATNRDLKIEIGKGAFREDLYYRLEAITLEVPPLRERADDISELATYFLSRFKTDFSIPEAISQEALSALEMYPWPGNVRELENIIRRVMALGQNRLVKDIDLPGYICGCSVFQSRPEDDSLKAYEKAAIENALKKSNSHRKKAADILKIGEATLYRKIREYWPSSPE